ncbi:MAG: hypothetical protein ASARMPRED_003274 [Alectoria sarmentosa]|nr:MAG: hypothetical protein ASARMPRED_003274 [Alectoria sarmentosa]
MEKISHPQASLFSGISGTTKIFINDTIPTSGLRLRSGRVIPKKTSTESQASASLASDQTDESTKPAFPFLKLPAELRVRIYRYLLHAHGDICIGKFDAHTSESSKGRLRRHFPEREVTSLLEDYGKMRMYKVNATGVNPAFMSVNRQTYLEASKIFYSENCFKFFAIDHLHPVFGCETIIPFLEDRSDGSRRLIKKIKFCYMVAFFQPQYLVQLDHLFQQNCDYLTHSLQLKHVNLVIFALNDRQTNREEIYLPSTYLATLDQQKWIQQLVPLVKDLDTFRITQKTDGYDDLVCAAQTYLESKMHNASK